MSVGAFLSISCQKDAGRERGSCREANSWKWPFFTFTDSRIGRNGNKGGGGRASPERDGIANNGFP